MSLELPNINANLGGLKYVEEHVPTTPKPRAPLPPAPEGAGDGHWIFGVQTDGIIHSGYSSYLPEETFDSPEEALEFWGELEEGDKLVRRWVPNALPWEDHS